MNLPKTSIKQAKYSNVKRAKVSAIAFTKSGQIIASAHNRRVYGQSKKLTQHAEEVLIQKLNKLRAFNRFKDITILVTRVNIYGMSMAKPCNKCQELLTKYKVNVLYTNWNGNIDSLGENNV